MSKEGTNIKKHTLGSIDFTVRPENVTDYINRLVDSRIAVKGLTYDKNAVRGRISWYDRKRFAGFNEENLCEVIEEKERGVLYLLAGYKKRTGFYIGVVLAVLIVLFGSNTVLRIEIYGNETVSDARITSALENYGISIGKFIPSINIRRSEQLALTSLDELRWMGIRTSGCVVKVEVSEAIKMPEMFSSNTPCNIISSKDAQIVDIKNVYAGMLVPMLYDGVKKGDILVSGTVKSSTGNDYYVHAAGEIIGRYKESMTFFQPFADEIIEYEDSFERKSLYLFGLKIPLYLGGNPYTEYEYSEQLNYLSVLGLKLPAGIVYSEYKPYLTKRVEYDHMQVKRLIEEKVDNYERNFYSGEDILITDRQHEWTILENGVELTVEYTIEGNIGQTQDIMAKY